MTGSCKICLSYMVDKSVPTPPLKKIGLYGQGSGSRQSAGKNQKSHEKEMSSGEIDTPAKRV